MKRIQELDALRGIALFGILLVNIFVFHAPYAYYSEFYGVFSGIEATAVDIVVEFAGGKFLFIFAFLFGYGIILQKRARPNTFSTIFLRRMLALLCFGIIHLLLFWFGDILTSYALLGFMTLPFLKLSNRGILVTGSLFILFRPLYYLGAATLGWPLIHTENPMPVAELIAAFQSGSYPEIFQLRMIELMAFMPENLIWYIPKTFGLFLLGIFAARKDLFVRVNTNSRHYFLITLLCVVLNLFWIDYKADLFSTIDLQAQPLWRPFLIGINVIFETALGIGYILGFILFFQNNHLITQVLAKTGRMAFTNYILQSFICVIIFYGFGFGYYGKLQPTDLILITAVIFAFNIIFSNLYLKYKELGPLEFMWRKLTNYRRPKSRI